MSATNVNALDESADREEVEVEDEELLAEAERLPLTNDDGGNAALAASQENGSHVENDKEIQDEKPLENKKKIEPFEIEDGTAEDGGAAPNILDQISQDVDDLDEEAQGLLAEETTEKTTGGGKNMYCCFCIGPIERLGSCTIFLPTVFARSGWGIMGPHWFGPPCVLGVLLSACSYFIQHAFHRIGPITGYICIIWTTGIVYLLANSAYRDPGIVRQGQETPTKNHRWCELCKNYQPPRGAHCPDCNVCIAGFDQ